MPHSSWFPVCRRIMSLVSALMLAANLSAHSLVKADIPLANSAVLALCQDDEGNMWIGTYDGLHLYNGKNTYVFRMELDNDRSLCSNIVQGIVPAEKGFLWVATSLGINKFSLRECCVVESWMQYVDVELIASDSAGNAVCIAEPGLIACYRQAAGRFEDIRLPDLRASDVAAVWAEETGRFCLLTADGLLVRYRLGEGAEEPLVRVSERRIARRPVHKAFCRESRLYFVDTAGALWYYSCDDGVAVMLSDLSALGQTGFTVSSICPFGDDIYVGFFAGALGRVPAAGGPCELIGSDHRIFCLWNDMRQDILWVGTDGYGAYMYCNRADPFTALLMGEAPLRMFKPVRAIHTDARGDLWIGTKGDGVVRIRDYRSHADGGIPAGCVTRYDRESGLTSNEVFGFCRSAWREVLWVATSGPGLSYYSFRDERMRALPAPPGLPPVRKAHQICEVSDSTLYVAADTEGLIELIVEKGDRPAVRKANRYRFRLGNRDCNEFYALIRESDSTLLLGMRGGYGVIRFDVRTKQYAFVDLHRLQSRALGDVLCLCKSRESGLYCGTSAGLIRMTPDGDIRQSNSRNGIVNDMVHGVLEDAHGCIWLSTNKGLVQYNPATDSFHNYSESDLPVIEFCDDAYWKCPYTGRLFFGGVNGVVWIDPSTETPADFEPQLRFRHLELPDGSRVPLGDWSTEEGTHEQPVRIAPHTSGFAVSFVAVDYLNGENYEYSYRLEGFDDEWVALKKENRVHFSNLPAGNYRLQVRYRSNVMRPTSRVLTLPIVVLPPWYRTTTAIVAYVAAFLGAVAAFIALLRRHYRREQQRVVAQIEEEQRERLAEARLNFFVNISHELCTPLTLINGMNERIARMAGDDERLRRYASVMEENVRGLNGLIREILDFRKIEEAGFGRVRICRIDVPEAVSAQVKACAEAAERRGIELLLEAPPHLEWNTDGVFLAKIVSGLLSNALQHTPSGGSVRLTLGATADLLTLEVRNTGRGIEPERLETLFDRYRVLEEMGPGAAAGPAHRSGLELYICRGLAKALDGDIAVRSEAENRTVFTVTLPVQELPAETPGTTASTAASELSPRNRKPLLLVVDDNKDIRWLIESSFSDEFEVLCCATVDEAHARLDEVTPELIVTDIVTDGADGLQFIASIRADRFLRSIPIVVVSSRTSEAEQAEGLAAGADAYLAKPFSMSVLHATIHRLIRNRRTLKEYYNAPESAYSVVEGQQLHHTEKAFMDAVVDAVQSHLESESLRMEQIAGQLGLTSRNFYRKFKKITGRTPSEFIKEYRFESAARLLLTTDCTIQEIMYRVGISNKSYFYREFQKKYGVKPKEYRMKR